jgi:transposase
LTTKLHVAVDALGNPLRVILSVGQVSDIEWAPNLIDQLPAQAVIADKGYDADHFVAKVEAEPKPLYFLVPIAPPRAASIPISTASAI